MAYTKELEIYHEDADEYLYVDVECEMRIDNDSFSHAFGVHKEDDYAVIEDMTYDETNYTKEQRAVIDAHILSRLEDPSDKICEEYMKGIGDEIDCAPWGDEQF